METWEEPMILSYGFLLDGVQSTRNLTGHSFLLYPDPEFEEFENKVKRFFSARNEYLTINVCSVLEWSKFIGIIYMYMLENNFFR